MVLSSVHPPLASAYLKLIRAQEHLDPLVASIRQYEMSRPYGYVRETDTNAGEHVVYAILTPPRGDNWYGPLGDVIHNLRAALDHAIYGLSGYCAGRNLIEGEARSVEWPVFIKPEDWADYSRRKRPGIRFLSPRFQDVVESEQPYRGPSQFVRESHPLYVLHSLWNLDKHRQISFFAVFGKVMTLYVPGNFEVPYTLDVPKVKNGSDVVRVPVTAVDSKEELNPIVQVEVALHEGGPPRNPLFGDTPPISTFLGYMHNRVFGVLQAFTDLIEDGVR